ncbi:MAG: HipA N-terminal domain-containing protein [Piscinibacter sp.]|nr:HipA N-terminal domain-containing protein [Piscinibacter sp.]
MADLHVWMNGLHVGVWSTLRTGTPVFRYDKAWVQAEEGRALSMSLPFSAGLELRGDAVTNYFDNLLPDSAYIRRRLRSRFRARSAGLRSAGGHRAGLRRCGCNCASPVRIPSAGTRSMPSRSTRPGSSASWRQ